MIHFKRVLLLLCDLFTDEYNARFSKEMENFIKSFLYLINKRFIVVSSNYWSSTTNASNTSNAWLVHFNNGNGYNHDKTDTDYVRCVRLADNDKKFYHV